MWDIHELCAAANADPGLGSYDIVSPRTIRWMSSEMLLPAKLGGERRLARYGEEHLQAIRKYRRLSQTFKVEQIQEIIAAQGPSWYEIAPGVVVHLDQEQAKNFDPKKALGALEQILLKNQSTPSPQEILICL